MSWVLDHSPTKGADRLVLIALANHAGKNPNNGAWESWPGVELIAREAGLDRTRTVQDALARLEKAGAIQRVVNGAPDERIRKDRRPNLYRVLLSHGVTADGTPWVESAAAGKPGRGDAGRHPDSDSRGDASRPDGVTSGDGTGCRPASPEPSLKPSGNRGRRPWEGPRTVPFEESNNPVHAAQRLREAASAREAS